MKFGSSFYTAGLRRYADGVEELYDTPLRSPRVAQPRQNFPITNPSSRNCAAVRRDAATRSFMRMSLTRRKKPRTNPPSLNPETMNHMHHHILAAATKSWRLSFAAIVFSFVPLVLSAAENPFHRPLGADVAGRPRGLASEWSKKATASREPAVGGGSVLERALLACSVEKPPWCPGVQRH